MKAFPSGLLHLMASYMTYQVTNKIQPPKAIIGIDILNKKCKLNTYVTLCVEKTPCLKVSFTGIIS